MGPWSQHPSSQQPSPTHIGRRSNGPALFGAVEGKRMSVGMQGRSLDPKRGVATAIAEAQANLERAVAELDRLPALDLHSIALAAHALNNFLTVSGGVVELLIPALRGHPDRQVAVWVGGPSHPPGLVIPPVRPPLKPFVGGAT